MKMMEIITNQNLDEKGSALPMGYRNRILIDAERVVGIYNGFYGTTFLMDCGKRFTIQESMETAHQMLKDILKGVQTING